MAFQPIVNVEDNTVFAYEALVRGPAGESAASIFAQVNDSNRYRFDQTCRCTAIELASRLGMSTALSINFLPNAVYRPELCIRTTLEAAETFGFPIERIIFEITEGEKIEDQRHLRNIVDYYRSSGFRTAIDDFGAGYSGLNLLAEIGADIIKIDLALVRDIHKHAAKKAIVRGICSVAADLGTTVIAEGIEQSEELAVLRELGIRLFQGYLLARPAFEALPAIDPKAWANAG
ncbi:EAL domain-containing protein [Silanimonas sp.]|uniref:EAL domain-containing protein n=1 Tax=Silanimonas sp. TaxID=1929290 RepID=UPI001BC520D0|nr:EAL domain-containing protein [Silanimonas sp.]MBS3896735.1 EAL domain-containing protein [Silanimonas sp.]MBS3924627.1 EAL domain-containing protein [Xanthomonadaceae bacterium]MBS3924993.1 EAL domain-containing protein [Xanthomonadaceae bacterium]